MKVKPDGLKRLSDLLCVIGQLVMVLGGVLLVAGVLALVWRESWFAGLILTLLAGGFGLLILGAVLDPGDMPGELKEMVA